MRCLVCRPHPTQPFRHILVIIPSPFLLESGKLSSRLVLDRPRGREQASLFGQPVEGVGGNGHILVVCSNHGINQDLPGPDYRQGLVTERKTIQFVGLKTLQS